MVTSPKRITKSSSKTTTTATADATGRTFIVGFGANYNYNFGAATRSQLPHVPLVNNKEQNGDDQDDDDHHHHHEYEEEIEKVDCYQLREDDTPWKKTTKKSDHRRYQSEEEDAIQVVTTAASSLFLTNRGKVFMCGRLQGMVIPKLTETFIPLPLKCIQLAAGRHFCLARMEGGLAVCSWGAGHFGQLGLGGESPSFTRHPTIIEPLLPHFVGGPIVTIGAGHWHAMAVTEGGTMYTWGCNRSAQCGFKPGRDPPMVCSPHGVTFEDVSSQPKIVKVEGGRSHSLALDNEGRLFAFGSCTQGQCGIYTRRRGAEAAPKQVESLKQVQVVDIAAGDTHSIALTSGGRVLTFGSGYEGQLGIGSIIQMNPKPRLVGDLDFVAIEAGREWVSQQRNKSDHDHSGQESGEPTVSSRSGDVGANHISSSSHRHTELSQVPKIVSVQAAGNCSMAISSSGHLYTWGCNDTANLGAPKLEQEQLPFAEPVVPPATTSSVRQCHTRSFDSSHNISLPQRVDCLRHINVVSVSSSSTFMWCIGRSRNQSEKDSIPDVGRTLYELQEVKGLKTLRTNRTHSSGKTDATDSSSVPTNLEISVSTPAERIHPLEHIQSASPKDESEADTSFASLSTAKSGQKPPTPPKSTPPKSPKSPSSAKGGKRRFSLPKAIGKMVRRTSKVNEVENQV